jgi:hypothetical protein
MAEAGLIALVSFAVRSVRHRAEVTFDATHAPPHDAPESIPAPLRTARIVPDL